MPQEILEERERERESKTTNREVFVGCKVALSFFRIAVLIQLLAQKAAKVGLISVDASVRNDSCCQAPIVYNIYNSLSY